MYVKSFIDVISTDPAYSKCTLVSLNTYEDIASGDPTEHECNLYDQNTKFTSDASSLEEVTEFRKRVTKHLEGLTNIILIDQNKEKIFSEIKNDPFFERLGRNVKQVKTVYQLCAIPEGSLAGIIKEAFPDPQPSSRHSNGCSLL